MNRTQSQPSKSRKPECRTELKERNFKLDVAKVFIDDDDRESENPCTLEYISEEPSKFCYYELHEFHRLRILRYHVQKGKRIIKSTTAPTKLSDEFIKKKFFEFYGPVNHNDPFIQLRWQAVRETVSEIKSKPDFHEITQQLLDEEIEDDEGDQIQAEELLEVAINQKYNIEEQHKYKNLNPHVGNGDWFRLPRLDLSLIRQQYFPDSDKASVQNPLNHVNSIPTPTRHSISSSAAPPKTSHSSSNRRVGSKQTKKNRTKSDSTSSVKLLTNLHAYDPKYELCFKPPYLILRREIETIEIPKLQSLRIMEHINRFPLGVTPDMFWEKFYKVYDYLPRLTDVPSLSKLVSLYDSEIHIANGVDKLPLLMFPSVLEGIAHPEQILKRVWHLIKCTFGSQRRPWIFIESLFEEIKLRYNLKFDPLDWDFPSVNDFLTFCIEYFGCVEKLAVYRQNYTEQHVSKFKDFFIINSEFLKEHIATLYGVPKTTIARRKPRKPMPKDAYVARPEPDKNPDRKQLLFVTDMLTVGLTVDLDIKSIHNYNHLSCVLVREYDDMWDYHESLQVEPLLFKFDMTRQPDPDHLKHGTYVMAYREFPNSKVKGNWYRAKVLKRHPTSDKFFVHGIDIGFMQYVERKDLRYMPADEIPDQIAHNIPIELLLQNPFTEDWNKNISVNAFTHLMKEFDYLRATLIEGKFDDYLGCTKWVVKCWLYSNDNVKRYWKSFNRVFLKEYKRRFVARRKRKEIAKAESESKDDKDLSKTSVVPICKN